MSRDSLRYLTAIVLLIAGVLVTQRMAPGAAPNLTRPVGVLPADEAYHRYIVDLDTWRATARQREILTPYDLQASPLLHDLPLKVGKWTGQDIEERNQEVFLILEPEQYVKRLYILQGDPQDRYIWLYLIGSRQLKSFHHPDICYSAIEWQTTVGSEIVPLDQGEIYALKLAARKEGEQHLSLYFFILPDDSYDESKGMVMFRVASPLWGGDEAETIDLQKDFIRQFFSGTS